MNDKQEILIMDVFGKRELGSRSFTQKLEYRGK